MRTIYWYLSFALSLIATLPKLWKVKQLEKQGRLEEKEAYVYQSATNWMLGNIKRAGVKVTVTGLENVPKDQSVVVISNHQSNFDIPVLMGYVGIPLGFISKIEAKEIPIVEKWMTLIHCVYIDRSTLKGSAGAIIEGIKVVKNGHSLVIFPEGHRSKGDLINTFKAPSFKLATKAGAPILPITIDGTYKVMEQNNNRIKPAQVHLTIHPAVPTVGLSKEDLADLPEQIHATIASALPKN